jgi:excisionase family DNA binding protein
MRYLTTHEVASALRVSETAVRRALKRGRLRGVQLAARGAWRIPATELEPSPALPAGAVE